MRKPTAETNTKSGSINFTILKIVVPGSERDVFHQFLGRRFYVQSGWFFASYYSFTCACSQ